MGNLEDKRYVKSQIVNVKGLKTIILSINYCQKIRDSTDSFLSSVEIELMWVEIV
jgi:hypothetical protein